MILLTLFSALFISSVAAWFSIAGLIALLDAQISIEQDNVNVSRTTLQQLDKAVSNLNDSSRVERAIQVRNSQRRERTDLNSTIATSNQKIAELKKQKAELNLGQRKLETEVGPIKYVAQLVYGDDDTNTIDKAVRLPATKVENTTNMEMDWNPGSWFRIVKSPKGK